MRAVLLLNSGDEVATWERDAVAAAVDHGLEIVLVAHCEDTPPRQLTRHNAGYYALAFASMRRSDTTRLVPMTPLIPPTAERVRFRAIHEGAWQRIPEDVARRFQDADVVIKFGMTLLRGADALPVRHGVLSFHHGAPEEFRGRPASYYELVQKRPTQGVIVQRLSDQLDGGGILARATVRVVPHSLKQTRRNAHRAGIPLLARALAALEAGSHGDLPEVLGPNYRLPGTTDVVRFVARLGARRAARGWYGATVEKAWRVGFVGADLDPESENIIDSESIAAVDLPPGHAFAADPFSLGIGDFLCEALDAKTGLGRIARWTNGAWNVNYLDLPGHASYPHLVHDGSRSYLLPEVATISAPVLIELSSDGTPTSHRIALQGLESERLADATLFEHEGNWFLFAGRHDSAADRLELWCAPSVSGPYTLHPRSPICLDVRGARMAGAITKVAGAIYRFGQDCSANYGGGVRIHRIDLLSREEYDERVTGTVSLDRGLGPHTLGVGPEELLIDYYVERRSAAAGYRRARALLAHLRNQRSPGVQDEGDQSR